MIEVTETITKTYDIDGLIERVKALENGLFAIKFLDFVLFGSLCLLFVSILVISNAHARLNEVDKILKDIKHE